MTTFKATVKKPRGDEIYSVYIRIVHNRKTGYIKTDKIVDAGHISIVDDSNTNSKWIINSDTCSCFF